MSPPRQKTIDLSGVPAGRGFSLHFYEDRDGRTLPWACDLYASAEQPGDDPIVTGYGETGEAAIDHAREQAEAQLADLTGAP